MKVSLVAHTMYTRTPDGVRDEWQPGLWQTDADVLAEFAGRACYQSWSRPNPLTATNEAYLANILHQQHFSVLEHASATFYITGVSRSLTHELIRHRHLSFSEMSQRFVRIADVALVLPPALREDYEWAESDGLLEGTYTELYEFLRNKGATVKQAREAARCVLPNATETKIVVTGNMRAWRDVVSKRNSPHADAEIQLLAKELLRQLKAIAPNTFQDMEI